MWTDERVELLKKLWNDGLSASQIAAELGGITRNAVIGKVHRLGLSGRAKSPASSVPRQRKPRASAMMLRVARPTLRGNTALARLPAYELDYEPDPEITAEIVPIGQRQQMPLADRRSGDVGFLLLRRQAGRGPALLHAPRPHRLPACGRASPRQARRARLRAKPAPPAPGHASRP